MVYTMKIYVDGGCRRNGSPNAIGAAAAVFMLRGGRHDDYTQCLPSDRYNPTATSQRAEITAMILALETALQRYRNLNSTPVLDVEIYSDSRYAVGCMNDWIYKWCRNGWINARGDEVKNRDLIQQASDLDDHLKEEGSVQYIWIPRSENELADRCCNEELDRMEEDDYSSDDSW